MRTDVAERPTADPTGRGRNPGLVVRGLAGVAAGITGWVLQQLVLEPGAESPWWEDLWTDSTLVQDTIYPVTFALGALVVLGAWWGYREGGLPAALSAALVALPLAVLTGVSTGFVGTEISADILDSASSLTRTDRQIAVQESTAVAFLVLGAGFGTAFGILTRSPTRTLLAGIAGALGAGLASYVAYEVVFPDSNATVRGYALLALVVLGVATTTVPGAPPRAAPAAGPAEAARHDDVSDEPLLPPPPDVPPAAVDLRDEPVIGTDVDRDADGEPPTDDQSTGDEATHTSSSVRSPS